MNQLPKTETRCTEIFSDTLRGYAGIQEVEYDYTNGNLKAVFDPHKISSERALEVVQHAGREASMRVAQCAAKRERGEEACAQCVGELAEQLAKQYESAATLPTATFRKNTLEVKLETSNLLSSEDNKVEVSFLNQNEAAKKPVAIPIERIEIAFTVINAITALTAFIGAGLAWHPSLIFGLYFVSYTTGGWFGLMASIKALKEKDRKSVV